MCATYKKSSIKNRVRLNNLLTRIGSFFMGFVDFWFLDIIKPQKNEPSVNESSILNSHLKFLLKPDLNPQPISHIVVTTLKTNFSKHEWTHFFKVSVCCVDHFIYWYDSQTKLDLLRPLCCKDDGTALLVRNSSRRLRLLRPKGERASTSSAHFLWGQCSTAVHSRGWLQPQKSRSLRAWLHQNC